MKISEIPFEPGKIVHKELEVGELHDGTFTSIPMAVINGTEKGSTVLVTAGVHGNIISAIEAARRISVMNPQKIRGRVAVIPMVNRPAFIARTRSNVFENFPGPTNMTVSFPGDREGIFSQRLAHVVSRDALSDVDYYVDLCTGALGGCYAPYVVMYPMPAKLVTKVRDLARAFGTRFIVDYSGKAPATIKGRPAMTALSNGIPAILSEGGEASKLDEAYVDVHVTGVNNVLKYLGMIDGQPKLPSQQITLTRDLTIRANRGGFLRLKAGLGEKVSEGQVLADITDVFYHEVEEILSPADGYLFYVTTTASVSSGDRVAKIGIPSQ